MTAVTVSSKFEVVIPKEVRESMGITPGEKLHVFQNGDRIELVRVRGIRELRGILKGTGARIERDEDRV